MGGVRGIPLAGDMAMQDKNVQDLEQELFMAKATLQAIWEWAERELGPGEEASLERYVELAEARARRAIAKAPSKAS